MKTKLIPFDIEKAKNGAKIVTRDGHKVEINRFNEGAVYPISAWIRALPNIGDSDEYVSFTEEGYYINSDTEDCRDLFIEVEETDDYNPYKEVVKSIADMVERYADADSDLQDFYDNVKVKCREAVEYDNTWNKKQDEKPADNKPKFQKGDWVVFNPGCNAHQIIRVVENATSHTYGYDTVDNYYFSDTTEGVRLWNIHDAKDGDVLVCIGKYGQEIGIVQKYVGKYGGCDKCFETYCFVDWEGIFRLGEYMGSKEIYPATKEQCDLLLQKMKEAGYEWNSDKKELHKIGEKVKTRRMTHQELAWWLREKPEEHRELKMSVDDPIVDSLYYYDNETNVTVSKDIIIRRNGGEWEEPLIEE